MLPVVLALEQSEGFFGTQLRYAGEVPNSETVENLCAGQFARAGTERAFDGFRGWRSHTASPSCQSRGELGLSGELIVRCPACLAGHSLVPKGDCPMRVSVVTFPVLRSRTVMVVILRISCTVTDLSFEKDWSILPICLPALSKG